MENDLLVRTKAFALAVVKLYVSLPKTTEAQVLGKQFLRSGTSVGAQYREGTFAKSKADFVSKIEGALQECEETRYWLELLEDSGMATNEQLADLQQEAKELVAILVTIARKSKASF